MLRQKLLMTVATVFYMFVNASVALAQTPPSGGGGGNNTPTSVGGGGRNTPPSDGLSLQNPLESDNLMELLQEILDVIMIFAVPLIVFMIIYAGFLYVTARGNESQVSNASRALLYAVIGGVIILGANIILAVISGTVDAFR